MGAPFSSLGPALYPTAADTGCGSCPSRTVQCAATTEKEDIEENGMRAKNKPNISLTFQFLAPCSLTAAASSASCVLLNVCQPTIRKGVYLILYHAYACKGALSPKMRANMQHHTSWGVHLRGGAFLFIHRLFFGFFSRRVSEVAWMSMENRLGSGLET